MSLKKQSVNWIAHYCNHGFFHIIFISIGVDALTNAEWWWKEQAKAAAELWKRILLRETWPSDTAIMQTMITLRKRLSVIIFSHCKIIVPWKSPFQGDEPIQFGFFFFLFVWFALTVQGRRTSRRTRNYNNPFQQSWQMPFWCSFLGSKSLLEWRRWGRGWPVEDHILP